MGPPEFVVALRLRERYQNGTPIVLPRATRAELIQSAILAGGVEISLIVPPNARFGQLEPGDTIRAKVPQTAVQTLKEVADSLKTQVSDILRDTRKLLATLDHTASSVETEMQRTAPEVRQTLADARVVPRSIEPGPRHGRQPHGRDTRAARQPARLAHGDSGRGSATDE